MIFKPYKEQSRFNWGANLEEKQELNLDQINCGALLRIADAVEIISKNYSDLLADNEFYKKRTKEMYLEEKRLAKRIAGLQGYINRLKKKK